MKISYSFCIDIDLTLARIEDLASSKQDLAVDESLILRGYACMFLLQSGVPSIFTFDSPQPGQMNAYKDALERLNTSIAFNAADLDLPAAVRSVSLRL